MCPSGKQFQNEAKEEKPARKDPSSPRSQGADEESSSWLRRRGGDSSQDTVPRAKELRAGLWGRSQVRPGQEAP